MSEQQVAYARKPAPPISKELLAYLDEAFPAGKEWSVDTALSEVHYHSGIRHVVKHLTAVRAAQLREA